LSLSEVIEPLTLNQRVVGSIPTAPTIFPKQSQEVLSDWLGGKSGALSKFRINGKPAHAKGRYVLAPDDVFELHNAGAGGYGPVERRSADKIERDLAEGYVTKEGAPRDYGFGKT
jgi:N-methylhydantoinase B/oxoprolinase/acetone carboxylase alpha subunit